ncbi:AraC family transcriptional regulator [Micromonospora sp. NPDC047548]|uniref:AraC family transcriptional regulator n=1 Tax=Micromonospora sp. NPDC047548 TaxID=3155624 RepID=UPI0033DA6FAC
MPGPLAAHLDLFWHVEWDLPDGVTHHQRLLTLPAVHVVIEARDATVMGPLRRTWVRDLSGSGWALGVMFRPGAFRDVLGAPVNTLTDRGVAVRDVFGPAGDQFAAAVRGAVTDEERFAQAAAFFADRLAAPSAEQLAATAAVERVRDDEAIVRVADLARSCHWSIRHLQRLFSECVGVTPKWAIRRYRLVNAAERVARQREVRWDLLAHELGYSDQSHLVRDFTSVIGMSPARYAYVCRTSTPGRSV